uniref:Cysteine protease n=1 Tax=Megaselia scalaris TaxID=36166 RepID=T1GRR2_MEGSC
MVLAQSLIDLHLGRDWFWSPETRDSTYLKIVNRFEDQRKSYFSLHQIALMGDSEDKRVGEWFSPNTVAQVLKFEDQRKSYFSLHQIALMGDSEDKRVGEWFSPNTVAQVL